MRVRDLAARAGVVPHIVRYYARIGLLEPRRDPNNRYREFEERDIARVTFIRNAQALGFTLEEVGLLIRSADNHERANRQVRGLVAARLRVKRRELENLRPLLRAAERVVGNWRPERADISELMRAISG